MIQPKNIYPIPTIYVEGLKEDRMIKNFMHCYVPVKVPIGQRKLWGIEYPVKPINVTRPDSSELLLELATISPDEVLGERIVSRILFKSSFVMSVYKKMLSIEVPTKTGVIPLVSLRAYSKDLERAFTELFWLIEGYEGMTLDLEHKQVLDPNIFQHRRNTRQAPSPHSRHAFG